MSQIFYQPGAEFADVSGMGMVGSEAPGGPEAADEEDEEDEEDEVLPDEARPFDTTAESVTLDQN